MKRDGIRPKRQFQLPALPQAMFDIVLDGDIQRFSRMNVSDFIDTTEPLSGMSILHIAVGRNNLEMTKLIVARGASFFPDAKGRWPSTIAALCEVGEELNDYIVEAEAKAQGV